MKTRRTLRNLRKSVGVGVAIAAGALSLHACGSSADAAPQPDPEDVHIFLQQLEAEQAGLAPASSKQGGRQVRNLVEGAATRAPSAAMITQLEGVVSEKLAG